MRRQDLHRTTIIEAKYVSLSFPVLNLRSHPGVLSINRRKMLGGMIERDQRWFPQNLRQNFPAVRLIVFLSPKIGGDSEMSMVQIKWKQVLCRAFFQDGSQLMSGLQDELAGSQEFLSLKRSDEIGLAKIAVSSLERMTQALAEILLVTVGYLDFSGSEKPGVVDGKCVADAICQGGC